jgi:large subunit ribosomal protein L30
MTKKESGKKLKVTLLKSTHGQLGQHRNNARGLGLKKRHHSVEVVGTPQVMGMVNASRFMFKVEEV